MWSKPSIPQISPKEPFTLRFYQSRDVLVRSWNKQNGVSLLADHKHELEFLFHSLFCVQCLGLYGSSAQWQWGSQMNEWTALLWGPARWVVMLYHQVKNARLSLDSPSSFLLMQSCPMCRPPTLPSDPASPFLTCWTYFVPFLTHVICWNWFIRIPFSRCRQFCKMLLE